MRAGIHQEDMGDMKVGYIFLVLVCRHVDGVDSGAPRNMEGRSVVRVK